MRHMRESLGQTPGLRGRGCAPTGRGCTAIGPEPMARRKRYLTATMADGYVKTIGPTADPLTHYWRIVAVLENGKTEVFWGHSRSLAEAKKKRGAAEDGARMRGWKSYAFEIAELVETETAPKAVRFERSRET